MRPVVFLTALMALLSASLCQATPSPETVSNGKALCAQAEKQMADGRYEDSLSTCRQILAMLPESPRAQTLYGKSLSALSQPTRETLQALDMVGNLLYIAMVRLDTVMGLEKRLGQTKRVMDAGLQASFTRLNQLAADIEETRETTTVDQTVTTHPTGDPTVVKQTIVTRVHEGDKARKLAAQTASYRAAAAQEDQFIREHGKELLTLEQRMDEELDGLRYLRQEVAWLYVFAARKMLDVQGYKLCRPLLNAAQVCGASLPASMNHVSAVCGNRNLTGEGRQEALAEMDKYLNVLPQSDSVAISLINDRFDLLHALLDSHASDEGGFNLSNVGYVDRCPELTRLRLDSNGQVRHIGSGKLDRALAASMQGDLFTGKWTLLSFHSRIAKEALPSSARYVFYQEGGVVYRELLAPTAAE